MLNNYLHDLATAVWLVSTLALVLLAKRAPSESGEVKAFATSLAKPVSTIVDISLIWIFVGGAIRAAAFTTYEWLPAAGRGQIAMLVVKHILLFAVVSVGVFLRIKSKRMLEGIAPESRPRLARMTALVALVALIGLAGIALLRADSLTNRFEDKRYSLSYPGEWREERPEKLGFPANLSRELRAFADKDGSATLVISVKESPVELGLGRLTEEIRASYPLLYRGTKVVRIAETKIDDKPALRIEMERTENNESYQKVQFAVAANKRIYWFTLSAPKKDSPELAEIADAVAGTIDIK